MKHLLLALLLTACATTPPNSEPLSLEEESWAQATEQAWGEAGRTFAPQYPRCSFMNKVRIIYGTVEETAEVCYTTTNIYSCATMQNTSLGNTFGIIAISEVDENFVPRDPRHIKALFIHEYSHLLRMCYYAENPSYESYHVGEDPLDPVHGNASDPYHKDIELWYSIVYRAEEITNE